MRASSAVLAIILATGEPFPGTRAVILSMVAGIGGVVALGCFYRALAIGTMSIVAPISATGVTLPVVVGIATGDRLSTIVAVGLAVTFVGVLLASREQHDDVERAAAGKLSVVLALVAAVGFGSYFVMSDAAADDSVLWLLVLSRSIPVPALALFAWRRGMRPPTGRTRGDAGRRGHARLRRHGALRGGQHEGRPEHRLGRRIAVSRDDADPRAGRARRAHSPRPAGGRGRRRWPASR